MDGIQKLKSEIVEKKEYVSSALRSKPLREEQLFIKGTQPPMMALGVRDSLQNQLFLQNYPQSYTQQPPIKQKAIQLSSTPQKRINKISTSDLANSQGGLEQNDNSEGFLISQQSSSKLKKQSSQPLRLKDPGLHRRYEAGDTGTIQSQLSSNALAPLGQIGQVKSACETQLLKFDRPRAQQVIRSPEKKEQSIYKEVEDSIAKFRQKQQHMSEPSQARKKLFSISKDKQSATLNLREDYVSKSVDATYSQQVSRKYMIKRSTEDGRKKTEEAVLRQGSGLANLYENTQSGQFFVARQVELGYRSHSKQKSEPRSYRENKEQPEFQDCTDKYWNTFIKEDKRQAPSTAEFEDNLRQQDIQLRQPQAESTLNCPVRPTVKNEFSMYDPRSTNYIYSNNQNIIKRDGNIKKFTFFGYNGNYPELQVKALEKRGCWKILNYSEQVSIIQKAQQRRVNNKKKQSDKPNYINVDEFLIDKCNFIWRPCNYYEGVQKKIDRRMLKSISNDDNPLVYNHFEVTKGIGTKSGLIRSLKQFYYTQREAIRCGYSEFDTTPTTYILQSKNNDSQLDDFQLRFKQIQRGFAPKEKLPMKHCVSNLWLVKPSNANQGRGIEIFSNLDQILEFINSRPGGTHCVVQKYVERPLLYKNRKFDIRVWVLATNKNELYFYKEGYLRTSSNLYSLESSNLTIHLTNQCLQNKYKDQFGMHEEGNTLSFGDFQKYLSSELFFQSRPDGKPVDINVARDLVPRMKDIVIDTFLAIKNSANPNRRKNHFELFGYDFLIDEDFRVWLIEVNTNPYLGQPNKWTKQLVPDMVDELFQIVLDPIYAPTDDYYNSHSTKSKNFELIYSEGSVTNIDYSKRGNGLDIINQRRPYSHDLLYPIRNLMQQNINSIELRALRKNRGNKTDFMKGNFRHRTGSVARDNKNSRISVQNSAQNNYSRRVNVRPTSAVSKKGSLSSPLASGTTPGTVITTTAGRPEDNTNTCTESQNQSELIMKKQNQDLEAVDETIRENNEGRNSQLARSPEKVQCSLNTKKDSKKQKSMARSSSRFDPLLNRKNQEEIFSTQTKRSRQKSVVTRGQKTKQPEASDSTNVILKQHQDYLKASKKRQKELSTESLGQAKTPQPNLSQKLQNLIQSGQLRPPSPSKKKDTTSSQSGNQDKKDDSEVSHELDNFQVPNLDSREQTQMAAMFSKTELNSPTGPFKLEEKASQIIELKVQNKLESEQIQVAASSSQLAPSNQVTLIPDGSTNSPKKYRLQRRSDFLTQKRQSTNPAGAISEYHEKIKGNERSSEKKGQRPHSSSRRRGRPASSAQFRSPLSRQLQTEKVSSGKKSIKRTSSVKIRKKFRGSSQKEEEESIMLEQYSESCSVSPVKCQPKTNEFQYQFFVKESKFNQITENLEAFIKLPQLVRQRQSKLFLENLSSVAQKFFIEEFGNLTDEEMDEVLRDDTTSLGEGIVLQEHRSQIRSIHQMLFKMIDTFKSFLSVSVAGNHVLDLKQWQEQSVKSPKSKNQVQSPKQQYQNRNQPSSSRKLGKRNRSISKDVFNDKKTQEMSPRTPSAGQSHLLLKPKCADIFVDLLQNDQLLKVESLALIAADHLRMVTEGCYNKKDGARQAAHEIGSARDAPRYNDNSGIEELTPHSQAVREHLLKKSLLKKLILIHQRIKGQHEETQDQLEQVLINLSCLVESRLSPYSMILQKKSTFWRRHEKNYMVAGEAKGLSIPGEVTIFRAYEDTFSKCLHQNGLIAYLCSNQVLPKTSNLVLDKALTKYDVEVLAQKLEGETPASSSAQTPVEKHEDSKPNFDLALVMPETRVTDFLKCIEMAFDSPNLKSRLRLHLANKQIDSQRNSTQERREVRKRKNSIQPCRIDTSQIEKEEVNHIKSMDEFVAYNDQKPSSELPSSQRQDGQSYAQDEGKQDILVTPKAKLMQKALKQQTTSVQSSMQKIKSQRQTREKQTGILERSNHILADIIKKKGMHAQPGGKSVVRQPVTQSRNHAKPSKSNNLQHINSCDKKDAVQPEEEDISPIRQYLNSAAGATYLAKHQQSMKQSSKKGTNLIIKNSTGNNRGQGSDLKMQSPQQKKNGAVVRRGNRGSNQNVFSIQPETQLSIKEPLPQNLATGAVIHTRGIGSQRGDRPVTLVSSSGVRADIRHQNFENYADSTYIQKPQRPGRLASNFVNPTVGQRMQVQGVNTFQHEADTKNGSKKMLQRKHSINRVQPKHDKKHTTTPSKQTGKVEKRLNLLKKQEVSSKSELRKPSGANFVASPQKKKTTYQAGLSESKKLHIMKIEDFLHSSKESAGPLSLALQKLNSMQSKVEESLTITHPDRPKAVKSKLSETSPNTFEHGPSPQASGPSIEMPANIHPADESNVIESHEQTIAQIPQEVLIQQQLR